MIVTRINQTYEVWHPAVEYDASRMYCTKALPETDSIWESYNISCCNYKGITQEDDYEVNHLEPVACHPDLSCEG